MYGVRVCVAAKVRMIQCPDKAKKLSNCPDKNLLEKLESLVKC